MTTPEGVDNRQYISGVPVPANKAIVAVIKGIERRIEIARHTTGFTGSGGSGSHSL